MASCSKKLIAFDLGGTLADEGRAIDDETANLVAGLMKRKTVAIISGSSFMQIQEKFLSRMPSGSENFSSLVILPSSGASLYVWKGSWVEKLSENLSPQEKTKIMNAVNSVMTTLDIEKPGKIFGERFEDRGAQITFSVLGTKAPPEVKASWDPKQEKRRKLADTISQKLPDFDVRIGGLTSIDITRRGVNKGFGIRKLEKYTGLTADEIIFIGNSLYYGGNDYPAKATGVDCVEVKNIKETKELIRDWIS